MKIINTTSISGRIINTKTGEVITSGVVKLKDPERMEEELEGLACQLFGTANVY